MIVSGLYGTRQRATDDYMQQLAHDEGYILTAVYVASNSFAFQCHHPWLCLTPIHSDWRGMSSFDWLVRTVWCICRRSVATSSNASVVGLPARLDFESDCVPGSDCQHEADLCQQVCPTVLYEIRQGPDVDGLVRLCE